MKHCFCGCGRTIPRFPLGMRSVNRRGKQVSERLEFAVAHGARDTPELSEWCDEGDSLVGALTAAMHGDLDPRTLDERRVRTWQAMGRRFEALINRRYAEIGRIARRGH